MHRGGLYHRPRSANIIRYAGLFIPFVLIVYGVLIESGIIHPIRAVNSVGLIFFIWWWLVLASLQFFFSSNSRLESALRLVAYHLLSGAYLIFVISTDSPLILCWIILMLAAYAYFGVKGFILNIIVLAIFMAEDIILNYHFNNGVFIKDIIAFTALVLAGIVIIRITSLQAVSEKELQSARDQELMQRDRALTIINNLADAVLSTDTHGTVKIYNAASMNLLDTNVNLNGHFIDEVLPLHDSNGEKVSLFGLMQESKTLSKRDDLVYKFSPSDSMILEAIFSPIRSTYVGLKKSGIHEGYVVILRDITKSKSLEEERDEFISVISHELRTPITITEGTISNVQMMMQHGDATKTMLTDAVDAAHEQIIFLAGMVNDLSTLSRAERGVSGEAEDIDVLELAQKMHDKYFPEAKAKKLRFDLDVSGKPGNVHVNRLYLEEILQNLITNGLKYTKEGGVKLIIKNVKGEVNFAVKDTGIGISKSDQAKIFQKFFRSEDYRTRETGGTGLGLYVVKKLSAKIGTEIEVTSRLNFGSTFSFSVPAVKAKTALTNEGK